MIGRDHLRTSQIPTIRRFDFILRFPVRKGPEYNRALIARGRLTLWIDEQAVSAWRQRGDPRGRGRPRIHADTAIKCALVVRSVFHLSLLATQGFPESVIRLMGVHLPVPAYLAVSRRQAGLELRLQVGPAKQPHHVVIDTTGLKVFAAGEWHVRKHGAGKGKRRTWRKLHLCVDETTHDIVSVDLIASGVHDSPHCQRRRNADPPIGELAEVIFTHSGSFRSSPCP